MSFAVTGARLFQNALGAARAELLMLLSHLPEDEAGIRISGIAALAPYLKSDGPVGSVASEALGADCRPVRAILFDKTIERNWALGWHQDRTICVKKRKEVPGFGPWSMKAGLLHVAPPFDLLTRMVTVRAHLDDVPETNAPLLIATGSHLAGRVPVGDIAAAVRKYGIHSCTARAGDVWLYSTPILHASEAATIPARRRVLQIDYAAEDLQGGLEWFGV